MEKLYVRHRLTQAALVVALASWLPSVASCAEQAVAVPVPQVDESSANRPATESAVFSGGCFWGVQKVFQHVKGVQRAVSGYAGGNAQTAQYEMVSTGSTGHAESVQVTFDPALVSYGTLLRVFFSVAHDPTEVNRQGPDRGTQYRSEIFTQSEEQKRIAEAYVRQLDEARVFGQKIATRIEPLPAFYAAEGYHQDYATLHPQSPYIATFDLPKVRNLERVYPDLFRRDPVLVANGR
jgi:peptide-methionine (S)-S-oxide reductase